MWSNKTQIKKESASFLGKYNYRVIGGNKKGLRAWPPIPAEIDFFRSSLSHDKKSQSHKIIPITKLGFFIRDFFGIFGISKILSQSQEVSDFGATLNLLDI